MHRPALVWLRRDLRLDDLAPLAAALGSGRPVAVGFALDPHLVDAPTTAPLRLGFLHEGLADLDARLRASGGGLHVVHGPSAAAITALAAALGAAEVHAARDDDPWAQRRDAEATDRLASAGIPLHLHSDHVVVPHAAVDAGRERPYATFSAYARAVDRVLERAPAVPVAPALDGRLLPVAAPPALPTLADLGRATTATTDLVGGETQALARLRAFRDDGLAAYAERRDVVGDPDATSRLSPYLHLGMLSPRRALAVADAAGAAKWRSELRWRDWFRYVLHHHPRLATACVDPRLDALDWPGTAEQLEAWRAGETGFGLVDAGMRQLARTGWLPNRVRMVAASLLVKHLGVDWRLGERWFRSCLLDGDVASNAGSWQWVAGTGLDAAPYFRVFNPLLQARRYDPEGTYVARWVERPVAPIVDLARARAAALARYGAVGR